ncbi:uncharacterized protein TM35_000431290 [Trypanosoma theileri]|uniref:Uncharacterized protein n=1 Tax=Trypanosoma theileri TaxID=67003 RepID=A0A1X0NJ04_9TRYP|nr:uncharacterized protein TM35_000431290 [Trypanosoma theileri]ORC84561.1 hypothetical protein TM35_000431290 [Trypanosoma theileri]
MSLILSTYAADPENDSFRVRVQQGSHFCPVVRLDKGMTQTGKERDEREGFHIFLENGPFSLRLESGSEPAMAVVEIDGIVFAGEHRLPPYGARTIQRLHEHHTATTRPLLYRKPSKRTLKKRTNTLFHTQEPKEEAVEELDGHTTVCRVFFLPVLGGVQATRAGSWRIAHNASPLAVVMFRFGHADDLSKKFGISKEGVGVVKVNAGDTPKHISARTPQTQTPTRASRSESVPTNMLYTFYQRSSSTRSNSNRNIMPSLSRSHSMDSRAAARQSSSLNSFLRTSSANVGNGSAPQSKVSKRRPIVRSNSLTDRDHWRPDNRIWSVPNSQTNKRRDWNMARVSSRSVSTGGRSTLRSIGRTERSVSNKGTRSPSIGNGGGISERGHSVSSSHGSHSRYRICVRCNVAFDRERMEYMEMIADLTNQVKTLKQENKELERKYHDATLKEGQSEAQHYSQSKERKQEENQDILNKTLNPSQRDQQPKNLVKPSTSDGGDTPSMDVSYYSVSTTDRYI